MTLDAPEALARQECEPGSPEWPAAARRVKLGLILEQIAEAEGIEVEQRDVDARMERVAAENGVRPSELRQKLEREDGLSRLQSMLRAERTLHYLIEANKSRRGEK